MVFLLYIYQFWIIPAGAKETEQIQLIFDLLGYPNSRIWPNINELPLIKDGTV